jgi:hypothetical protein
VLEERERFHKVAVTDWAHEMAVVGSCGSPLPMDSAV